MSYLEMVNNVLRRLRERTVGTVTVNDYSRLIGILINDAKREVENAWNWSQLRNTTTIATVATTHTYELNGVGNRVSIIDVFDNTNDNWLHYVDSKDMREWINSTGVVNGKPKYYTFVEGSADGDPQIQFYPVPDDVYSVDVRLVERPIDLVDNGDTTVLPVQPIVLLAYAKAIEERGEDAGVNSSSAYFMAKSSLADHVAMDANRNPEDILWREV